VTWSSALVEKWRKQKAEHQDILDSQTDAKKAVNRIDGLVGSFGCLGR
jgi:hypothetical protein